MPGILLNLFELTFFFWIVKEKFFWHLLEQLRKTLFGTTVIHGKTIAMGREIRFNSTYNLDNWGFMATEHNEESVDRMLLIGDIKDRGTLAKPI